MIIQETFMQDDLQLTKTYSDAGFLIRQDATGDFYPEAIDPTEAGRTYTETDIPIEEPEEEQEEEDLPI